jgi:hypothetical protein
MSKKKASGFLSVLLLSSCLYRPEKIKQDYREMDEVVHCLRINHAFYMDRYELSIFCWQEYMYWTAHVFGEDSPEYAACKPDIGSLNQLYRISDFSYPVVHSGFHNYPMVGVSQQQAEAFSKWRSDRVFEYILIHRKILDWHPDPGPDTYFTTERYFSGEYQGKIPSPDALYYPVFSLPVPEQFELALHYTDSVKCKDLGDCWWGCFPGVSDAHARTHRDISGWAGEYATRPVDFGTSRKTAKMLYHLVGNVAEWSSEPGIIMGGSWNNDRDSIAGVAMITADSANAWTGFRNVLTWKKWEYIDMPKILDDRIR